MLVDHIDNLLANLFKIIVELVQSGIEFLLLDFEHVGPLILQLILAFDELLLALPPGSLVHLVLLAYLSEIEVAVVYDRRVVLVLVLHPLLKIHRKLIYNHQSKNISLLEGKIMKQVG